MIDVLLPAVLLVGIATLAIAVGALRSSRRSQELGEDRYELLRDQHDRLELLREERRTLIEELERESQERRQLMEALKGAGPQLGEGVEQALQKNVETARRAEQQEQQRRLRLERELRRLEQELEQEREARAETERRVQQQEQERRRLEEELKRDRRGRLEVQQRLEQLEQVGEERSRIEQQAERATQNLQQLRVDLEREREQRLEAQRRAEQLEQERLGLEQELGRSKEGPGSRLSAARPWWRKPISVVALLLGSLIVWLTSLVVALNLINP
jgi:colicin import membrane protein